jgi:hypothetical protein
MYLIRKHLTAIRWLAGLVMLLTIAFGAFFGVLPLTVAALIVAAMPGTLSVDIPFSRGPGRYALNAALILLSALALATVLWLRHSDLPAPAVVFVAVFCCWELVAVVLEIVLVWNSGLRQRLYERRRVSEQRQRP